MGILDSLKVSRKTFFNPRAWLGYDSLKGQTRTIVTLVKEAAPPPTQPTRIETFAEAMKRLGLKEEDIQTRQKTYFIYALGFLSLAILDFIYGIYLLFNNHAFLGLILALAVCALILSQAFKYHFWYFQIKHRKLGCTFEEWRAGKILSPETSETSDKANAP